MAVRFFGGDCHVSSLSTIAFHQYTSINLHPSEQCLLTSNIALKHLENHGRSLHHHQEVATVVTQLSAQCVLTGSSLFLAFPLTASPLFDDLLPFSSFLRDILSSLGNASTLFESWRRILQTVTSAENEELLKTKEELLQIINTIDQDLEDLDDAVKAIIENPQKFNLTTRESNARKQFVDQTRRKVQVSIQGGDHLFFFFFFFTLTIAGGSALMDTSLPPSSPLLPFFAIPFALTCGPVCNLASSLGYANHIGETSQDRRRTIGSHGAFRRSRTIK